MPVGPRQAEVQTGILRRLDIGLETWMDYD